MRRESAVRVAIIFCITFMAIGLLVLPYFCDEAKAGYWYQIPCGGRVWVNDGEPPYSPS